MKMKFLFLWLILTLATVNAIIYFSTEEMEDAVVALPSIKVEELLPEETIVTGVCTFGDCPVATNLSEAYKTSQVETSQNIATTSQSATEESTLSQVTANSQLLTEPEPEEPETEAETATMPETELEPEPEEAPETSDRTVRCFVTAYCGCESCSGEFGPYTCFGTPCRAYHTIAVDPSVIPYGTQVEINGITYTAEDCGGGINGYMIDVYFAEHWQCEAWPTGYYDVTIY